MAKTFQIETRAFGAVTVRHLLTQKTGMVRVEITDGEDKGCSFVITPEQFAKAQQVA